MSLKPFFFSFLFFYKRVIFNRKVETSPVSVEFIHVGERVSFLALNEKKKCLL